MMSLMYHMVLCQIFKIILNTSQKKHDIVTTFAVQNFRVLESEDKVNLILGKYWAKLGQGIYDFRIYGQSLI